MGATPAQLLPGVRDTFPVVGPGNMKGGAMPWIKAAAIRAVKTWAQAALAYLGTGAIGVLEVDWVGFLSVTCLALLLSVLTSLAGLPECEGGPFGSKEVGE